ncbi:Hypothetical predicted protein [Olea europaea subsp. europaea]|uniref:Uncharacterized protein n=1 Tax=Olea europaea subsp. europaea TaxID=158383 RepID=A0A8S0RGI6_OLEEU|nr:Hypothetical predicted protein [Olea europaea subsp. europaea]
MPTFTAIALENLLEPRVRDSCKKPPKPNQGVSNDDNEATERKEDSSANPRVGGSRHIYISPALYVTPEPAPIPGNSSSNPSSPSPYVVNHKRRGGVENGSRRVEKCDVQDVNPEKDGNDLNLEEGVVGDFVNESEGSKVDNDGEYDGEGISDPRSDRLSVGSFDEVSDFEGRQIESRSFGSAQAEFFDANDEFSCSSSSGSSHGLRIAADLHATRLSLLEEIERRKTAEENLKLMCYQWERISNLISQAGLTFPAPPTVSDSMQLGDNSMYQFSQEVVIARFVAEAVGRGQARAEAELAANAILESKDQEISRLQDKLLYYETVNHEMSQRNLVVARRQQQRKRSPRRWLWSCLGLSIAVGASVIAYSYIPDTSRYQPLLNSGASVDASHISTSSETP